MSSLIDFVMHLDRHVASLVADYGVWAYAILFLVIFAETGLIIFPFLPGDSLLFLLGVFSGPPKFVFDPFLLFALLAGAAMLGDQVSYRLGQVFGHRLFTNPKSKIFKPDNLAITHAFYEQHGPKTVLLARFVPIVRGLAPFVAGMSDMDYRTFCGWSVSGAALWVGVCVFGGRLFGQIPVVQKHFELGLLVIVLFSIVPAVIEFSRHGKRQKAKAKADAEAASNEAA